MTATLYLWIAVGLLAADTGLQSAVEWLNLRRARPEVPPEFAGWYDAQKYARAQDYLRADTRMDLTEALLFLPLTLAFILLGGFRVVNDWALAAGGGMIVTGLLFAGLLMLISLLARLPFKIHATFGIEQRFGFNRTTPRTFLADQLKAVLLAVAIGGPMLALVLWFFARAGAWAWLCAWAALAVIRVFLMYGAPVLILPLFNKFVPLADGPLRRAIEEYARAQHFTLRGIFTIDGSRRSTRANAYFTGFGRWRRIALFDTLIARHPATELVAVLAHEVGHARLGHVTRHLAAALGSSLLLFWLLAQFISRPALYEAFGLAYAPVGGYPPIYAGLALFGFFYAPIERLTGIATSALSRRHEYAADAFAARTTGQPRALAEALRRLSVDNLSNLTPHPLKVWLEYSHPPVLARIRALERQPGEASCRN